MKTKIKMNNGDEFVAEGYVKDIIGELSFNGAASNHFVNITIKKDDGRTIYKHINPVNVSSIEEHNG